MKKMKDCIVKYKLFVVDVKKEENWIDSYREQGYRLEKVKPSGIRYQFKKCSGDFVPKTRIDFRKFTRNEDYRDYLSMFEDSGWKLIQGSRTNGVQYFQQINEDAQDDIFSDEISAAERYKRISDIFLGLSCVFMSTSVALYITGAIDLSWIYNPKQLYLTPGIWDMKGLSFLWSFLFETPFAIMRGLGGFFPLILLFVYGYFGLKSYYCYKKEKTSQRDKNLH